MRGHAIDSPLQEGETSQTRLGFPIELMVPLDVKPEKGGHYQCHHRRKRRR